MYKLSIITAVYNAEQTIGHTMDSVASQNAAIFEHIIVDGLSTDRTLEIVEAKKLSFTKIISEKDAGIYDAFNKGVRAAAGDVVGFIHADDFYPDQHVLSRVIGGIRIVERGLLLRRSRVCPGWGCESRSTVLEGWTLPRRRIP